MTVEIAVLNKSAVALAADSAVTLSTNYGNRVYSSASKLFALSDHQPIGIMIYGADEVMEVPWESVIRLYRRGLANRRFPTVEACAEDFLQFVQSNAVLCPSSWQAERFANAVERLFSQISTAIEPQLQDAFSGGGITEAELQRIIGQTVEKVHGKYETLPDLPTGPPQFVNGLLESYAELLNHAKQQFFAGLPMTEEAWSQLGRAVAYQFTKDDPARVGGSGVVIAGFGDEEVFPLLVSYKTWDVIGGRLQYKVDPITRIDFETPAQVVAFAQDAEIRAFLYGVHPDFASLYRSYVRNLVRLMEEERKPARDQPSGTLEGVSEAPWAEAMDKFEEYLRSEHVKPMLQAIDGLPKDELAGLVEALVSLTALKQRMTPADGSPSVGGPVDVAVISRGDGFVWIRRKRYFEASLNPPHWQL